MASRIERSIDDAAWRRGDHDRVIRWYLRLPREAVRSRYALGDTGSVRSTVQGASR